MDVLYNLSILIAGLSLVLISTVIPWGVFTRYGLNSAASWPEPMAILLTIVLTFFGAAACYRIGMHVSVTVARNALPAPARRAAEFVSEVMMGVVSLFMVVWGAMLSDTTWHQTIADFPFLSVGLTYLPIPVGGAVTLLFVIERIAIGPPPAHADRAVSAATLD